MKSTLNHYKEVRSIYLYRRCRVEVKPDINVDDSNNIGTTITTTAIDEGDDEKRKL